MGLVPALPDTPIAAQDLVKRYDGVPVVDGIDITVAGGACLALLGPNGAGKTTTLEMLEGLIGPDSGRIRILGLEWDLSAQQIRRRIGVQIQETRLQEKLTVFETLRMMRGLFPSGRSVGETLELIDMEEKSSSLVGKLSGGEHQRLALGCALVNRPEVLMLDEPTTGLDPRARRHVWVTIERVKDDGGTVLLATHFMDEAEFLADEVAIFERGRILAIGSPADVVQSRGLQSVIEFHLGDEEANRLTGAQLEQLRRSLGCRDAVAEDGLVQIQVDDLDGSLGSAIDWMRCSGYRIEGLRTHRPTLEDVFLSLTGKRFDDEPPEPDSRAD